MKFQILKNENIEELIHCFWENNLPKVLPANEVLKFGYNSLKIFMLEKGIYVYPTK